MVMPLVFTLLAGMTIPQEPGDSWVFVGIFLAAAAISFLVNYVRIERY